MSRTKCEKLLERLGEKVECDVCHNQKVFNQNWRMSGDKAVVCPECQGGVLKVGKVLVNI